MVRISTLITKAQSWKKQGKSVVLFFSPFAPFCFRKTINYAREMAILSLVAMWIISLNFFLNLDFLQCFSTEPSLFLKPRFFYLQRLYNIYCWMAYSLHLKCICPFLKSECNCVYVLMVEHPYTITRKMSGPMFDFRERARMAAYLL